MGLWAGLKRRSPAPTFAAILVGFMVIAMCVMQFIGLAKCKRTGSYVTCASATLPLLFVRVMYCFDVAFCVLQGLLFILLVSQLPKPSLSCCRALRCCCRLPKPKCQPCCVFPVRAVLLRAACHQLIPSSAGFVCALLRVPAEEREYGEERGQCHTRPSRGRGRRVCDVSTGCVAHQDILVAWAPSLKYGPHTLALALCDSVFSVPVPWCPLPFRSWFCDTSCLGCPNQTPHPTLHFPAYIMDFPR